MTVSLVKTNSYPLTSAVFCSLGLMIFSWFIQYNFPWKLISFAALSFSAFVISLNLYSLKQFTGTVTSVNYSILLAGSGILGGLILAAFYRNYLHQELLPSSVHYFALIAALVGSTEELVFRGFLQELTRPAGSTFSILFSTLSHTGYKCFLFISPAAEAAVDIGFLFKWTFAAGIIFGISRYWTKSIIPAMIAHAVFDIVVYGSLTEAPWWVW